MVHAQSERVHFRIRYVINVPEIDSTFVDNAERIQDIREFLQTVKEDSLISIRSVKFRGTASPDGGYEFNCWLSENRLRTFKKLVGDYIDLPDSLILANVSDIPWDGFREKVAGSDLEFRDRILEIIDEGPGLVPWFGGRHIDPRLLKLKRLGRGKAWESLKSPILQDLRYGDAEFEYFRRMPAVVPPVLPLAVPEKTEERLPTPRSASEDTEEWMPRLYVKTNVIGLAALNANLAVEADIARHWSVTLPVYYCGMDWFTPTVKFRNFSIQPEVRYWFRKSDNDGFFLGVHFGMSYYNFAFGGDNRWQDYRGRTPALGGGLSAGYRLPISRDKRWRVEFALGAGVYPLDYEIFENTADVRDGILLDRVQKTYIGIDKAAVTFSYSFDLKKFQWTYPVKGGRR